MRTLIYSLPLCFILITLGAQGQERACIDLNENWKVASLDTKDDRSMDQILRDEESQNRCFSERRKTGPMEITPWLVISEVLEPWRL